MRKQAKSENPFETSIKLLNAVVADELTAVMQYMYFHFRCDDMGYKPIAALFRRIGIQEMMHVEWAAERAMFLKGEVEMIPSGKVAKIHDVREMLAKARDMEMEARLDYAKMAAEATAAGDFLTKDLFERLIADEESHWDQFDQQVDHIDNFGEAYLALQSFEGEPKPEAE